MRSYSLLNFHNQQWATNKFYFNICHSFCCNKKVGVIADSEKERLTKHSMVLCGGEVGNSSIKFYHISTLSASSNVEHSLSLHRL